MTILKTINFEDDAWLFKILVPSVPDDELDKYFLLGLVCPDCGFILVRCSEVQKKSN